MLHSVEIARAAGIDLWDEVISQAEFNALSRRLPVLVNMRPFGAYSMVDVEANGGLPVDRPRAARRLVFSTVTLSPARARRSPSRSAGWHRPLRSPGDLLGGPAVQGHRRPASAPRAISLPAAARS